MSITTSMRATTGPVASARVVAERATRAAAAPRTAARKISASLSSASSSFRGAKAALQASAGRRTAGRSRALSVLAQGDRLDLDPDNASILVCGGGGVALEVTRKLKNMGSWVWMLQRTEERRAEIEGMMAVVSKGDAMDVATVAKAFADMEEVDAVVSTIGGTTANPTADSEGNMNIIKAALEKGVRKFVLVTSIGTGDSKGATPEEVYEVLKPVLIEKEKAENLLMENADKMQFVIIRPGGLKSEEKTGNAVLTEDKTICGAVTRADVAEMVAKALFSDNANNKVLSCVDSNMIMESSPKEFEVFQL
eukprot:jgi/Tetstr1/447892/TSEL_035201.t1